MRVADAAGAIPSLLLVGLLPGLLLSVLLAPRWSPWLRLAAAPGLSCGALGVLGLVYHDLHVPFTPLTVLIAVAVLGGAAGWRLHRTPAAPRGADALRARLAATAALLAGLVSVIVLGGAFGSQVVPVEADAPVHASIAERIASGHDTLPIVPEPVDATGYVRPRTAYEAEVALVSQLGGPDPAHGLLPVALLSVLLLPLGLAALVRETTGSWLLAGLAPVLSLGMLFPPFPTLFGEFPLIVDSTLVAPLVIAGLGALRGRSRYADTLMVGACVASVWVIHGTEVLTAALIAAPLVAAGAWSLRAELRRLLRRVAAPAAAAAVAAIAVTLLTRPPAVPAPQASTLTGAMISDRGAFADTIGHGGLHDVISLVHGYLLQAEVAPLLYLLGIVAILWTKRNVWALLVHLAMLACLVDVEVTGTLERVWTATYPWSTVDRLLSMQFFVLPLIMAQGVVWATHQVVSWPLWTVGRRLLAGIALASTATAVTAGSGIILITGQYDGEVRSRTVVDATDVAVMERMASSLPAGTLVATDGADAGQWIDVLTPERLYFTKQYIQLHNDDARLVLLDHACDGAASTADAPAMFHGVEAVFVGIHQAPDAPHRWNADCLARLPWLHTIARASDADGVAAVFRVEH